MDRSVYISIIMIIFVSLGAMVFNFTYTSKPTGGEFEPPSIEVISDAKDSSQMKTDYNKHFMQWKKDKAPSEQEIINRLTILETQFPQNYRFTLEKIRGDERISKAGSRVYGYFAEVVKKAVRSGEKEVLNLKEDLFFQKSRTTKKEFLRLRTKQIEKWKMIYTALEKGDTTILK